MKNKCKHVIITRGWSKKLVEACLNLESFVEGLEGFVEKMEKYQDGITIANSFSDHQPSYVVRKQASNKRFFYIINPRIINGVQKYLVFDETNKYLKLLETSPERNSFTISDEIPGTILNPHVWDIETLGLKIKEIDVNDGFTIK